MHERYRQTTDRRQTDGRPMTSNMFAKNQWRILTWGASTQRLLAAWDVLQVLYLPARQCSCSLSTWDNQPSETRYLRSFYQICATKQHRSGPNWLQKYGRNAAAGLASSWRWWIAAVLDRCLASFQAKRHWWRSWQVAQIRPNVSAREFVWKEDLLSINSNNAYVVCLLILGTLSKRYCVKCSRISPFSFFYISQGNASTHLRCGKQCGMDFVANVFENTTVKEFWQETHQEMR